MKRRDFIRTSVAGSLLSLLPRSGLFAEGSSSATRPNVLFLFSDQHNATVASYAGHPDVHTPALDGLAASGVRFNRTYCPDGVCCPSRTSMMTGQYPRTLGYYLNEKVDERLLTGITPMQEIFHRAGYYTFTTGKRHLIPTADIGWDYRAGDLPDSPQEKTDNLNYWDWIKSKGLLEQIQFDWSAEWSKKFGGNGYAAPLCSRLSALPPEATMEAFAAWQTNDFLRSAKSKDKPFFAWSTFYRPHQPYTPLKKWADRIDYKNLTLPASLHQNPDELPPWLAKWRRSAKEPWNLGTADEAAFRTYIGYYYALVHEIDDHIGTILKTLDEEGLAENTIVLYSADHGDFVGNHGLVEKGVQGHNFFEDTLRVPLIVRWPGKIPPGVRNDLVEQVDLYPTLLDLCGLKAAEGRSLPGRSLKNALVQQTPVGRNYIVSENWSQASVITNNYKYGQWLNCPIYPAMDYRSWGNMFMERSSDPHEMKNLFSEASSAPKIAELQGHLTEWVGRVDDTARQDAFARKKVPYTIV